MLKPVKNSGASVSRIFLFSLLNPVRCLPFAALFFIILASKASALTINLTYDSSVTSLTNASQVETAINTAAQTFQNRFTNAITINITVYWGNTGPFSDISLGESQAQFIGTFTYAQITNALRAMRVSTEDSNSVASLPVNDPNPSGPGNWLCSQAEARALGLFSANDPSSDGSIGFASNKSYTFDPNNRAVSNKFDLIGVAEHEISEVMGRTYLLGYGISGYFEPYDLFRFTNSGMRSFSVNDTNVYFSIDNGITALKYFYTNVNMGDIQDWQSSTPPDTFDAFVSAGYQLVLSSADITALDILGYNGPPGIQPHLTGVRLANGNFQLTFTNTPNSSFSILTTTNLRASPTIWSVLGTATQVSSGHYQFTDTQTSTNKRRFYQVSSP